MNIEKAILQTLIYADIFDFPLKAWEIHKWLIGKKASLRQIEKALRRQSLEFKVKIQKGYYFLKGRENLVSKRLKRKRQSQIYFNQAKLISQTFKLIPWVKLVGISGSLAMENSTKKDDIDLFIITQKNRLFLSRLLLLGLTEITGKRRKKNEKPNKTSGKICINTLLEEENLGQKNKNIYLAHEILQMKVLWQKDRIYQKFLEENNWVFKYLPNWISGMNNEARSIKNGKKQTNHNLVFIILDKILDFLENLAKNFQLKYIGSPKGDEKILNNALFFHPIDHGKEILKEYQKRLKRFKI
ncbi:hypothetical protein HYS97_00075 [Candidatus Daviesbacteria bacterium]|nr:hypothetical protein [Candidatus Daviesbacteria bacterium]